MKRILHVEVQQLHSAVLLQRPVHVPDLPVRLVLRLNQGQAGSLHQHFRHVLGDVIWGGKVSVHDQHGRVGGSLVLHLGQGEKMGKKWIPSNILGVLRK